jgi:hypothetical protein
MSTSVAPQSFKGYSSILITSVGLPCFSNLSTLALLGEDMAECRKGRRFLGTNEHKTESDEGIKGIYVTRKWCVKQGPSTSRCRNVVKAGRVGSAVEYHLSPPPATSRRTISAKIPCASFFFGIDRVNLFAVDNTSFAGGSNCQVSSDS